jgi:heme-degrading monooxygenase HmoA
MMNDTPFPDHAILEVAHLDVKAGETEAFEAAFAEARRIIASMPSYRWHQLQRCVEDDHRYLLLVSWERLEDHTEGFRGSPEYTEWKRLLHYFYAPFPTVEHYRRLPGAMQHVPQTLP